MQSRLKVSKLFKLVYFEACDRVYRVGQKKEVKIHRFVVKDSVEEKILLLQEKKLNLANDVLTGTRFSVFY